MASTPERQVPPPPTRTHIPGFAPSRPPPPRPDMSGSPARPRRETGDKQPSSVVPEPPPRTILPILLDKGALSGSPRPSLEQEPARPPRTSDAGQNDGRESSTAAEEQSIVSHEESSSIDSREDNHSGTRDNFNSFNNNCNSNSTFNFNDNDSHQNASATSDSFVDDDDDASFLETLSLASVRNSMNLDDELSCSRESGSFGRESGSFGRESGSFGRESGSFGSLPFSELAPAPPTPPPVAPRPIPPLPTQHRAPSNSNSNNSNNDYMNNGDGSLFGGSGSSERSRESADLLSLSPLEQQQLEQQQQLKQFPAAPVEPQTPVDHRTKIVGELIATERVYISRMGVIIDVYMEPLQSAECKAWTAGMQAGWVGQVFSNIEAIRQFHQNLYTRLADERFARWDKDTTKIADIFVVLSPYLKLYLQYCNNYDNAMSTFMALRKKHPLFDKYLVDQRDHPGCIDRMQLEHLLISPVQRIPRYILLLRDLLKHTPQEHPDYNDINAAITHVQNIANSLDQRIGDVEKANHVLEIQTRISGCPEIVNPSRYLVREGAATLTRFETSSIHNAAADQKVTFYLFNDSLLAASLSDHFKGMVMFLDTSTLLRDLPDTESVQNAFYLVSKDVNWTIRCATAAEKQQWLLDIQTQIDATRAIQRSRTRTIASTSQATPQVHITAQITATEQIKPERKTESEYTVYHLSTCIESSGAHKARTTHTTVRRFREFCDLHAALKQQFPQYRFSPLPAKKAFGTLSQKTIENRRIMLEICLNDFLAKEDVAQDSRLLLFLALNQDEIQQMLEPAPRTAAVEATPMQTPTPTPPARPQTMFGPAMSIDLSELRKVQTSRLRQIDE